MIALGFLIGAAITAPIFWLLGRFARLDSRITHEPADIGEALRRSK